MCDTRTDAVINLCRQGADAEHKLAQILTEKGGWQYERAATAEALREAVAARGGTEALRFLERALALVISAEPKAKTWDERVQFYCEMIEANGRRTLEREVT